MWQLSDGSWVNVACDRRGHWHHYRHDVEDRGKDQPDGSQDFERANGFHRARTEVFGPGHAGGGEPLLRLGQLHYAGT
jgi:hypothetical protein